MFKKRLFFLLPALVVLTAAIGIGVVRAQMEDAIIHACVSEVGSNSQARGVDGNPNTGSVRIVSSEADCRSGERYLWWNQQGTSSSGGDTLRVMDSLGQEVGLFNSGIVMRDINGYQVAINVGPKGIIESNSIAVFFESSDCTGTPLTDHWFYRTATHIQGKAYFAGETFNGTIGSASTFTPPSTYGPCDTENWWGGIIVGVMESTVLPELVPPFELVRN